MRARKVADMDVCGCREFPRGTGLESHGSPNVPIAIAIILMPNALPSNGGAVIVSEDHTLNKWQELVESARARLAEVETIYTIEKAKVDSLQAMLFSRLREYFQERDRLGPPDMLDSVVAKQI